MMAVNIGYVFTTPPSIAGDVQVRPLDPDLQCNGGCPVGGFRDDDLEVELWMRGAITASDVAIPSQMLGRRFRV
jgi:hypothetical protein